MERVNGGKKGTFIVLSTIKTTLKKLKKKKHPHKEPMRCVFPLTVLLYTMSKHLRVWGEENSFSSHGLPSVRAGNMFEA